MHPLPADTIDLAPSQGPVRDAILDTLREYCIDLGATWTRGLFGAEGFSRLPTDQLRAACRTAADEHARRGLR